MRKLIRVTDTDILRGYGAAADLRSRAMFCPVAEGVRNTLPNPIDLIVTKSAVAYNGFLVDLPRSARRFITLFDRSVHDRSLRSRVAPFNFYLEVPDEA